MNKIIVAAFVLSAMTGYTMTSYQAAACDWEREAAKSPSVVADCGGGNCATEPTAGEPTAAPPAEPAEQKIADEQANPAPTTLAACTGSAC